jgi:RES domain-containing protein
MIHGLPYEEVCSVVQLFQIAQLKHPISNGLGGAKPGGRWNSPVGLMPWGHGYIVVTVPEGLKTMRYPRSRPPRQELELQRYGDVWLDAMASAILLVPSPASLGDWNELINPPHRDFSRLAVVQERKVISDKRHFRS